LAIAPGALHRLMQDGDGEKPHMVRAKSKTTIMVADGAGGMAKVQDRRFETGDWPIRLEVPQTQADTWFRYFYAECGRRGWSSHGIGQLEARENSGSITGQFRRAGKPAARRRLGTKARRTNQGSCPFCPKIRVSASRRAGAV
jgi:hypothetical protein